MRYCLKALNKSLKSHLLVLAVEGFMNQSLFISLHTICFFLYNIDFSSCLYKLLAYDINPKSHAFSS